MAKSSPAQTSFNAGELSPLFFGRADMAKYGNGCATMRNFLPLPQGPAMRRPGTRFVQSTKTLGDRCWLIPFVFSEADSFMLEFGDGYIRFYTDNAPLLTGPVSAWVTATAYTVGDLVEDSGTNYYCITAHTSGGTFAGDSAYWYALTDDTYEVPSPYDVADLTGDDDCFLLTYAQTGDVIFLAGGGQSPRKLTRVTNNRWTLTETNIQSGPFIGLNPDETTTVYASAISGTVTLTASASIFTSEKIGTLFLLEQKAVDDVKAWEPAKAITSGSLRRSDSNVYEALNSATTGSVKPVHREGARFDGDAGVQWKYRHSGYGIARITAVGGTTATATVISEIPTQAVGSGNASLRWSFAAWDSVLGFPTHVVFQFERLMFLRGNMLWGSVSGDFENFASRDGAETLPDSAVTLEIASSQVNAVLWVAPSDDLLVGTRGGEFAVGPLTDSEPFGPGNAQARRQSSYGSRQVQPAQIGDSVVYAQPSGRTAREMRYTFSTEGYESNDLTVIATHIAKGQIIQMAYAQAPHSIALMCCADGSLIALTLLLEQEVIGWVPLPTEGYVESVAAIPSPDGTYDQWWMIVRRTINGVEQRYVEYVDREWDEDIDALRDALYSDCALTFDGRTATTGIVLEYAAADEITASIPIFVSSDIGDYLVIHPFGGVGVACRFEVLDVNSATSVQVRALDPLPEDFDVIGDDASDWAWARDTITGLSHLDGEEVTVLTDGAEHPTRVVESGTISLQLPSIVVQVGLPAPAEITTMRIEAGALDGTAQGKTKRIHRLVARLYQTLGGKWGMSDSSMQPLMVRRTPDPLNNPPSPLTGDTSRLASRDGYTTEGQIRLVFDTPLPATVVALFPQLVTEDSR